MLKGLKNQGLKLVPPSHVDLFVENYDQLKRWALQFTNHDQYAAEDLLHDTFINFTLGKPDLTSIQNLNGYLYTVMRNLHLSEVRRASRMPVRSFSVVEYDTAEMQFWASDPRERLRMRDELGAVCQYACVRKQSSKGGSLLILRFFHGYYPEEIASIMRTVRVAVNAKLTKVRAEAKLFLEDPDRLRLIGDKLPAPLTLDAGLSADGLRLRFREHIFDSREGPCLSQEVLDGLYLSDSGDVPHRKVLAHIVSCETCIEKVNSMLGIPTLASRYPLDMIGNDPGKRGGGTGGGSGSSGAGGDDPMLDSYINRREAHYHHEPRELCISVNGHFQGLQKIVSGKGDLLLPIETNETVGFVEVFSELGVRLLMLHVEPPPVGDGNQTASVELSGGRLIEARLNFSGVQPALQVSYTDPELSSLALAELADTTDLPEAKTPEAKTEDIVPPFLTGHDRANEQSTFGAFFKGLMAWSLPVKLAAASALLIAVATGLIYLILPTTAPPTAASVLANASQNEVDLAARPDLAIRSTFKVEEYSNGSLVSRRRVDEWRRSDASARRVFDEKEKMVAGEWRKDGTRQVFKLGEKLIRDEQADGAEPEALGDIRPSAAQFASLLEKGGISQQQLVLEQNASVYNITYRRDDAGETEGRNDLPGELLVASLVLDRINLRPRSETLVLKIGDETREYHFTDIFIEQKPVDAVSPLVFLPEPELTQGQRRSQSPSSSQLYQRVRRIPQIQQVRPMQTVHSRTPHLKQRSRSSAFSIP